MSQPNEHTDLQKDDHLVDFTNQVLNGKTRQTASTSDEELLGLERTILRLKDSLPSASPDEALTKQMLVRFKARVRREEQNAPLSFWKRLFDFQANPQVGMIMAVVAVVALALVTITFLQPPGYTLMGTSSGSAVTLFIGVGLFLILILVYWFSRRK